MIEIDGIKFEIKEIKSRENIQNPEVAKFVKKTKNRIHDPDFYKEQHEKLYNILSKNFSDLEKISRLLAIFLNNTTYIKSKQ